MQSRHYYYYYYYYYCVLILAGVAASASRFQFQGPVLTLTLKDPISLSSSSSASASSSSLIRPIRPKDEDNEEEEEEEEEFVLPMERRKGNHPSTVFNKHKQAKETASDGTSIRSSSTSSTLSPKTHVPWWNQMRHNFILRKNASLLHSRNSSSAFLANILNLDSLAPTILCSLRTIHTPLPNYLPALKAASLTAAYNYQELKTKPSVIETDVSFYSNTLDLDLDVASTYNVRQKHQDLVIRLGRGNAPQPTDATASSTSGRSASTGSNTSAAAAAPTSTAPTSTRTYGGGFYGLVRFVRHKGQQIILQHASGQYRFHLPFQTIGSVSITPSYDFLQQKPTCSIVGKSGSGRTATLLDLNWDRPTLSVVHALDEKNTIQPEISLYDAKILYNWSFKLMDGSGIIKTRVDPTSAIQVTWIDQARNGKWVTDFRLPLVGMGGGPLTGDIRVRRQFVF